MKKTQDLENKLILGECVSTLKSLPARSFDFIFADPPYFMQVDSTKPLLRANGSAFSGCDDDWDKFPSMESYKNFTREWLTECYRTLKDSGSICVISGMQSIYEIGAIMRESGFWLISDIIWKKTNPTPNFAGNNLCNAFETLLWAKKGRATKHTLNYKTAKALNGGKQLTNIWEIPVCAGAERLKDAQGQKLHSTQKPLALMRRIIGLFTRPGDLVCDPFGGSFSTAYAAKELGRRYFSIERERRYFEVGKKRVEGAKFCPDEFATASADSKAPRVAFAKLVESKLLKIGEFFYTKNGQKARLISKDGKASFKRKTDSIHAIAAVMLNRSGRINAYTHLYIKRGKNLVMLDSLRKEFLESAAKGELRESAAKK